MLFNAEMVAASTFSREMLEQRGKFFAEESYWIGFRQIYSPGGNIHRTPYSGRNYEYYSEDANMSYILSWSMNSSHLGSSKAASFISMKEMPLSCLYLYSEISGASGRLRQDLRLGGGGERDGDHRVLRLHLRRL